MRFEYVVSCRIRHKLRPYVPGSVICAKCAAAMATGWPDETPAPKPPTP